DRITRQLQGSATTLTNVSRLPSDRTTVNWVRSTKESRVPRGRILVVDDEVSVRESVRLVLDQAGYEVIEAEDGARAMETVQSGDNPSRLDAVILDLYMPKIHGQAVIYFLRSNLTAITLII